MSLRRSKSEMTPEQQQQLIEINREVNQITFTDLPGPGEAEDWWTDVQVPGRSWVCRDYVLAKADRLRAAGWSGTDLTVVLCWTELYGVPQKRDYHAVLAVEVGEAAPMILDSRFEAPYTMSRPPAAYVWDRRQIPGTVEFEPIGGVVS